MERVEVVVETRKNFPFLFLKKIINFAGNEHNEDSYPSSEDAPAVTADTAARKARQRRFMITADDDYRETGV